MTSKLDTAGLVRFGIDAVELDMIKRGDMLGPKLGAKVFAALEALTQAATPGMTPVAWQSKLGPAEGWVNDPLGFNSALRAESEAAGAQWRPLYSASQLSALQERAERAERERDEAHVLVPRDLLRKANAVMRECGWHLAISAEPQGDGVLEAACTEVEADFATMLAAAKEGE